MVIMRIKRRITVKLLGQWLAGSNPKEQRNCSFQEEGLGSRTRVSVPSQRPVRPCLPESGKLAIAICVERLLLGCGGGGGGGGHNVTCG